MKKSILMGMLLVAGVAVSQNAPKLEAVGSQVKATYYYDNGQIAQQGMFKEGKPDGKWVAFNEDGSKKSIGEYAEGTKTGKWFFWNGSQLNEVDYNDSRVAAVKSWTQQGLVQNN